MATFNTDFYTATKEARVATGRLGAANIQSGDVQFAVIPYTLAGTEAAADVINLCLLPAGAIPIPQLSKVTCTDPGTTLTLDIGTAADTDGWARGIVMSAGGNIDDCSGTMPAWVAPTPLVADTGSGNAIVKATVASAASLTAATVVYFLLAWKLGR